MKCHQNRPVGDSAGKYNILLMGNPNVGKSVIFSRLTGQQVYIGNYAGSTVNVTQGHIDDQGQEAVLIDVPGIYSLSTASPAEKAAVDVLQQGGDMIIFVLDATNLEQNLNLALTLKKNNLPLVYALNFSDVAQTLGIGIDVLALSNELEAPVIPTIAVRNIGLDQLLDAAWQTIARSAPLPGQLHITEMDNWSEAERIVQKVQKVEAKQSKLLETLEGWMIRPFPGLLIALLVLFLILALVVGGGKALRAAVLLPLVNGVIVPFLVAVFSSFIPEGLLLNVLVGEYGVLVKGIEWPFALILPYVFLFYIALSILEDSGYLPRLGVLVDGIMQKMGVQGDSVVPFIMGYGCAVPAILGTRAAASIKERVIIASMVAVAVPCVSQTGAFIALLGDRSVAVLLLVFFISLGAIFFTGYGLNRMIPGKSPPLVMEIPHLLMPDFQTIYKKVKLRLRHFVMDAQGPLLIGIFLAALLVETGGLTVISELLRPLVVTWLGLPPEASMALLLGVIRKELAVLPLLELNLSILQLLVASVVALFYLPCFAVLVVLMRELGLKIGLAISVFTIAIALLAGGIINQAGSYLALWL